MERVDGTAGGRGGDQDSLSFFLSRFPPLTHHGAGRPDSEIGGWDAHYAFRNPPPQFLESEVGPLGDWVIWQALCSPRLATRSNWLRLPKSMKHPTGLTKTPIFSSHDSRMPRPRLSPRECGQRSWVSDEVGGVPIVLPRLGPKSSPCRYSA